MSPYIVLLPYQTTIILVGLKCSIASSVTNIAHLSDWAHSFTRLLAVVRSAAWERIDLLALLKSYGTTSVPT